MKKESTAPAYHKNKTFADKLTTLALDTFGSAIFLIVCLAFFALWICWNSNLIPGLTPFDKYPFPVLEMVVSLFAVVLTISVLISQNRQRKKEKIVEELEFEVNIHSEKEITKVLDMLHTIQKKLGITNLDSELEDMKENLDIKALHDEIEKREEGEAG